MRDGRAQCAVVDAQHERHTLMLGRPHPPRAQPLSKHDARLDVDHVVLGQHRHRDGVVDAGRVECGGQRGVSEDHRHVEFRGRREEPVAGIAFDDDDVVARGLQVGHHPDPEGAQPDDDDVVRQFPHLPLSRVLCDAAGQE